MNTQTSKAFEWYGQHRAELQQYAGKHLAIVDEGLAAVADTAYEAYQKARQKYPTEEPLLTFIPKADALIL